MINKYLINSVTSNTNKLINQIYPYVKQYEHNLTLTTIYHNVSQSLNSTEFKTIQNNQSQLTNLYTHHINNYINEFQKQLKLNPPPQ